MFGKIRIKFTGIKKIKKSEIALSLEKNEHENINSSITNNVKNKKIEITSLRNVVVVETTMY